MRREPGLSRAPWIALLVLVVGFELPWVVAPNRVDFALARVPGDLLVLLTFARSSRRASSGRSFRAVLLGVGMVLFFFSVDRAVVFALTRAEPVLYDQMFLLRHVPALIADLGHGSAPFVALSCVAAFASAAWATRSLVRRAGALLEPARSRETARALGAAWAVAIVAAAAGPSVVGVPLVRFTTLAVADSVAQSAKLFSAVRHDEPTNPSPSFDAPPPELGRKPDVFLFFIESYGRVATEEPDLRGPVVRALSEMAARLSAASLQPVSAYATAEVSGGRSWLASASVLAGTPFRYEADFRHRLDESPPLSTLTSALEGQGYGSVLLAPADRARLGISPENPFRYARYVRAADLGYSGPGFGWGVIPDQYALGFVEERVLRRAPHPWFLHFHMVSSHALWSSVPALMPHWNDPPPPATDVVIRRCKNAIAVALCDGYVRSLLYDLRVIEEFLLRRDRDFVAVVLGDHQPPAITSERASFDVPVHVIARDPAFLAELLDHGFARGLVPPEGPAGMRHTGLRSLFVRALVRGSGSGGGAFGWNEPNEPLPPYFPSGVPH